MPAGVDLSYMIFIPLAGFLITTIIYYCMKEIQARLGRRGDEEVGGGGRRGDSNDIDQVHVFHIAAADSNLFSAESWKPPAYIIDPPSYEEVMQINETSTAESSTAPTADLEINTRRLHQNACYVYCETTNSWLLPTSEQNGAALPSIHRTGVEN